jgi:hypothetical protein
MLATPSVNNMSVRFGAKVGTSTFEISCIAVKVVLCDLRVRVSIRCLVITLALKLLALIS